MTAPAASHHDDAPRAWTDARIVLPDRVVDGHALLVEGGRIVAVCREADLPHDAVHERVDGAFLAPGFVDVHTHGALGVSFLGGDDDAFGTILEHHLRHGTTSVAPTTSTAPIASIVATLERSRAWRDDPARPGARVIGVHVEGPYFAASQAGAQDPDHLRSPDDGTVDGLLEHADVTLMMSYAPELPGAETLTRRLVALGIVAAAGHSEGRDTDLARCQAWGLSHAIHLWSGQSTTVREGPYRRPGLLEASLASTSLTGEVIADGHHLPPTLLRLAYRAFGPERLCLVSDALAGAGLPVGAPFTLGERTYEVGEGVGMMPDRSAFAGSVVVLDTMVRVMARVLDVPLHEAVRMASLTPATVVGIADRVGSVATGKIADLVVLSDDLRPLRTVLAGRTVAHGPRRAADAHRPRGDLP